MRRPALNKHPVFQHLDLGFTYFQSGKKISAVIRSMVFSYSCRYELRQSINLQLDDKQWAWEGGSKVKRTLQRTVLQSPVPRSGQTQPPGLHLQVIQYPLLTSTGTRMPTLPPPPTSCTRVHTHTTPTPIIYTCAHP